MVRIGLQLKYMLNLLTLWGSSWVAYCRVPTNRTGHRTLDQRDWYEYELLGRADSC